MKKGKIKMEKNENGYPRITERRDNGGCSGGGTNGNGSGTQGGRGCGPGGNGCSACLDEMPLAYAYVPIQRWQMLYPLDKGLMRGTIFEELDKPTEVYGNEW